ncbi:hypothetical protein SRB5_13420 [Streptomyces sp. RB5]|uniref:HTH cro/C1-type domain-containing protein n=1 Tax=Streptomyces smaragdinus TaxID=2585196 RepID=A0A7K0CCM9_9ACTN|nr:helix-turn-helix transcriptional regulator [Streptomyces smaragdinus]MQY11227.1 hypothetical protein [Streptomyces smaragdinus]
MTETGSPSLKMFGALVRSLREAQGVSRDELGAEASYSKSQIAMIERGERMPSRGFIDCAELRLDARGAIRAAAPFLTRERYPAWFGEYVELEARALSVVSYDPHVLKGLLQTEDYARAVLAAYCPTFDEDEVERRVQARLDRRTLLTRRPAPTIGVVVEEPVLRRPIGGRAVMRRQLEHLADIARMRNVSVQVMPLDREVHCGLDGPMTLLETEDRSSLAYVEGQGGSMMLTDPHEVSAMAQRFGVLRAQALSTSQSLPLIERLAGEL